MTVLFLTARNPVILYQDQTDVVLVSYASKSFSLVTAYSLSQ